MPDTYARIMGRRNAKEIKKNIETVEPVNWIIFSEAISGKKIDENTGELTDCDKSTTTGFIPVKKGDKLTLLSSTLSPMYWTTYAVYDENYQVISFGKSATSITITDEGAKYFRFSIGSSFLTGQQTLTKGDVYPGTGERYFDPYTTIRVINRRVDNAEQYNHLPRIDFYGDISGMSKDIKKVLEFCYIGATNYVYNDREAAKRFSGFAKVKWQGATSIKYPKKNYSINLYKDKECTEEYNIEFKTGWGKHNKYVLKANFIDPSHARNIIGAKLWGQMVKSRNALSISYKKLKDYPNGGAVDGYPIRVYFNGEYKGLYTFNLPKDGYTFGMTEGSEYECLLSAEQTSSGTNFEDTANIDGTDFAYVVRPRDTSWVFASFNAIYNALQKTDTNQKKTALEACLDIESIIDHMIFTTLLTANDNRDKNFLMGTYDGIKWFLSQYDMDGTFGNRWHGCGYYSYKESIINYKHGKLCQDILSLYKTEFKNRYAHVRGNIINTGNLQDLLSNFLVDVPIKLLERESEMYPSIPGTATNNIAQIINYMEARFAVVDPAINAL